MARDRIDLPRLLSGSRSTWVAVAAAYVGGLALLGWYAATDEENRPFAVALGVLLVAAGVLVVARRRWLDPASGDVVVQVAGVWRRRWRLAEASAVTLVPNNAGQVLLRVEDPARRTPFHHVLLARDLGGERTQPAEHLRLLAEQVQRWTPRHQAVVDALGAQADHVSAGGALADSPLARRHLRGSTRTTP